MTGVANALPQLLVVIGALAFLVSVVTEVFKNVGFLANIPTDLIVIVLSLIFTLTAFMAYADYTKATVLWYGVVAAIVVGFIVAFVAMYGWTKFKELWDRFNKNNIE